LAQTLETDLDSLGELAMQGSPDLEVSSLCATFAVTEVISLLARGHDPADIAASVHMASAYRLLGLIGQVGKVTPVALTGGVARNRAAIHYLEELLRAPIQVPDDPKITGAYGAALLAQDALAGKEIPEPADPADDFKGNTMLSLTTPSGRVV
jgi:activator of 2-hydroxyglutaryl-CoA dehydratase